MTARRLLVRSWVGPLAIAIGCGLTVALLAFPAIRDMAIAAFTGRPDDLRALIHDLGPFAPVASVGLNVAQGVLAPIPGFVVPYVNGVVFGTLLGGLLSWIGGLGAAAACFGIARTVGRDFAERMCRNHRSLDRANRLASRHGMGTVILARVAPGMPFDAISYLAGLTRIRFWQFITGTAIGSAPHAFLYALVGEQLDVPVWIGLVTMPAVGALMLGVAAIGARLWRPSVEAPAG